MCVVVFVSAIVWVGVWQQNEQFEPSTGALTAGKAISASAVGSWQFMTHDSAEVRCLSQWSRTILGTAEDFAVQ